MPRKTKSYKRTSKRSYRKSSSKSKRKRKNMKGGVDKNSKNFMSLAYPDTCKTPLCPTPPVNVKGTGTKIPIVKHIFK